MNWLILQSGGEHKGQDGYAANAHMRECLSLQYFLDLCGHTAKVWGPRHPDFNSANPPSSDWPDYVLCLEQYGAEWVPDVRKLYPRAVKMFWAIDLHCAARGVIEAVTPQYDIILHSTYSLLYDYAKKFPKQNHEYFPNCYDPRWFYPQEDFDKNDKIIFVGEVIYGGRGNWVRDLQELLGDRFSRHFALGADMVRLIQQASVHMNRSIAKDVNYRCFETVGCGTVLCTDRIAEMADLGFKDNVNCILYDSTEEAVRKIRELLQNKPHMRHVEQNALDLAKQHTYSRRVDDLLIRLAAF